MRFFPTRARELAEEDLLGRWAAAVESGRDAAEMLRRAEQIATGLARRRGEHLLADAVGAIRGATAGELRRLARAHRLLATGMDSYHRQRFVDAERELSAAGDAFAGTGSPYGHVATLYRAICVYYGNVTASRPSFQSILAAIPRDRYPSLAGRALWMQGTVDVLQSRFEEAVESFNAMRALLERSSDPDQTAMADVNLGETYELWGEVERGWLHLQRGLGPIIAWGNPRRRHSALHSAAQALVWRDQPDLALIFLDEVIANAKVWGQPLAETEAYSQRSRVRVSLGDTDGAVADAWLALRAAARMPDGALRDRSRGSALLSEGMALVATAPHRALRSLHEGYSRQQRSGWEADRLPFLNAMAHAQEGLGDRAGAEKSLLAAVESYETLRRNTVDPRSRITVFRHAQATFDQLVGLSLATLATDPGPAFDAAERARGRYLLDAWTSGVAGPGVPSARPVSSAELTGALPAGITLVTFTQLPDRVVGWVAGEGPLRGVALRNTGAEHLDRLAWIFVAALVEGDEAAARRLGAE
ncbi:MAG: hypothetical protein ACRD2T_17100, partial [Thermoanaerobaculia bacterium]